VTDVVGKLWGFCNVLRHDGMDYGDYIEQLTYLLFLKMSDERGLTLPTYEEVNLQTRQPEQIPCDWPYLRKHSGTALTVHYIKVLTRLGAEQGILGEIFAGAQSRFTQPVNLQKLIQLIDETDWTSLEVDVKAEAFEGLLEKAAAEGKKGAGQYFTPRVLIQSIVRCMQPDPRGISDFAIGDPTCGTGGFLVAAYEWLKQRTEGGALDRDAAIRIRKRTYFGQELVPRPRRLALMNLYLHQVEPHITLGDSIYDVAGGQRFDVILTNPPFGIKGANQAPDRDDFTIATSNKQLNLVQHVMTILKPGGRAAMVVPDNVLFLKKAGDVVRFLMEDCEVHTILRCPRGTFSPYTQGTNTYVIFFTKGRPTEKIWLYDARANVPKITKKSRPLAPAHLAEFEHCYGTDPFGRSERNEADSPDGRWRCYSIDDVKRHHYRISKLKWLRDEEGDDPDDLSEPEEAISDALEGVQSALTRLSHMQRLLGAMTAPVPDPGLLALLTAKPDVGEAIQLSSITRSVEQFRQSILGAACYGRLTTDWRSEHREDAARLVRALRVYRTAKNNKKPIAEPDEDLVDELPPGWQLVTLDLLIRDIEAGKSFSALGRSADSDEWGVIKVSAMSWGSFLEAENKAVPDGREINPSYEIKQGDLLLSRANTEDLVGATVLVGETRPRLLLSDKSLRLIPQDGVDKSWLNYTLRSPLVRSQFSVEATGTSDSMRNLSQDKILAATVPLPPTDEQVEIGRRVAALLSLTDGLGVRG
jgi:type I restriction enzyme M protein